MGDDGRLADAIELEERRLHGVERHLVPANLHLEVDPTQMDEAPVVEAPAEVPGEAESLAAGAHDRETGGGQVRLTPVARGDVAALHGDLAGLGGSASCPSSRRIRTRLPATAYPSGTTAGSGVARSMKR